MATTTGEALPPKTALLWDTLRSHGEPLASEDLSQRCAAAGAEISPGKLESLQRGTQVELDEPQLRALARAFGVPVEYLLGETITEEMESELRLLRAMQRAQVNGIAMRTTEISTATRSRLIALMDAFSHQDAQEES